MKYFHLCSYTPYCGESLDAYVASESEEKLYKDGIVDDLIADTVADFFDGDDYEVYGFDCPEDFEEYYYSDSGCEIREITKEEYDEYKQKGW